jgi:hypothetical protein
MRQPLPVAMESGSCATSMIDAVEPCFELLFRDGFTDRLHRLQDRCQLSVAQTLRMFFRQARNTVQPADRDAYIWEQAQTLAQKAKGWFDQPVFVAAPPNTSAPLSQVFGDVDQNSQTRLVILDPRRWSLNNSRDTAIRTEVAAMLGVGEQAPPIDNGASCVVVCVNTQRRDALRRRATDMLAWAEVLRQLDPNEEKRHDAQQQQKVPATGWTPTYSRHISTSPTWFGLTASMGTVRQPE